MTTPELIAKLDLLTNEYALLAEQFTGGGDYAAAAKHQYMADGVRLARERVVAVEAFPETLMEAK